MARLRRMRMPLRLVLGALMSLALGACSALVPNSADELLGRWEGTLLFRSALTPIELEVRRGSDSALVAVLHARELLIQDQPVDSLAWDAPRVHFACTLGEARLPFAGFARAGRIVGRFTSPDLPTTDRAGEEAKLSLRRTQVQAPPVATQRVRIEAPGAAFDATLRLPLDSLAHPGLVFAPSVLAGTDHSTPALADTFARSGWATLTWDATQAPGDDASRVAASAAAVRWLAAQPGVAGPIGLWESCERGTRVPQVASRAPLAFAIARSPRLATSEDSAAWAGVRVPALLVFGDRDAHATLETDIRTIMRAAGEGGVNATLRVFPGADASLRLRSHGEQPFDWPRAAPGAVDTLLAWSARLARLAPRPARPDTGIPRLELRPGWR